MRIGVNAIKLLVASSAILSCAFISPQGGVKVWEKPIAPGLVFREEVDYRSHHSIFALRLSLESSAVRPVTALAGGKTYKAESGTSRLPVSGIVSQESALAGINGDFFSMSSGPSGDPLGILVRNGRLLATPSKRVAFGWGPVEAKMSTSSLTASLETKSGSIKIDGINRRCPNNEITLNTENAGRALAEGPYVQARIRLTNPVWLPSTVIRGRVISVTAEPKDASIGTNEAVITARGAKVEVLNSLAAGAECYIKLKTMGFDWERIDNVIGGGPMLVKDGTVDVDGTAEGFGAEFVESKHPRTAIGRTADNDIWMVAVDGRQETGDGMNLDELAHYMQHLGCVDAMNLDGGGSTTMNVLGVTVNRPSDGKERPVADAVVITGPRPIGDSDQIRISAPTNVEVGRNAKAKVMENGIEVPEVEVFWGASGACAIDAGGEIEPLHSGAATLSAFCRGHLLSQQIAVSEG